MICEESGEGVESDPALTLSLATMGKSVCQFGWLLQNFALAHVAVQ
jgi:hypothetical protein